MIQDKSFKTEGVTELWNLVESFQIQQDYELETLRGNPVTIREYFHKIHGIHVFLDLTYLNDPYLN